MSMSEDTENFQQLRRLLALKRYEQPPPGYFNNFSRQVILRIQAGERGGEVRLIDQFSWEAPWLQRIWAALETQPVLAGAFGMVLCSFLIFGVVYADRGEVATGALASSIEAAYPSFAGVGIPQADHSTLVTPAAFQPAGTSPIGANTDEILLRALGNLRVQAEPAGFRLGGGR
jgi:hypothetical protein